ncbi:MAG: exonuclease domain-containing protein [Stackebrandtia sp.]
MYAVIDLETTGVFNKDRIVEVAIVHADADGGVTDVWHTLVNPERDLGPTDIHGIRAGDVRRAPKFAEIAGEVAARMAGRVPVVHNISFDSRMLRNEYLRMKVGAPYLEHHGICTMRLASQFLPGAGRALSACCEAVGIDAGVQHTAAADAKATARLLRFYIDCCRDAALPWQSLHNAAQHVLWPQLPVGVTAPAHRRAAGHDAESFVSRLVPRLPRVQDLPGADSYLSLLDKALFDRHISDTEADLLVSLAAELGIDQEQAAELHRRYLTALAFAAVDDGEVAAEVQRDLEQIARLLCLPADAAAHALKTAKETDAEAPHVDRFSLAAGDVVVLTGAFREGKEHWARQYARMGLSVAGYVTKKTALVAAADPDTMSGKAEKARRYGVPVVKPEAVLGMLPAR